MRSGTRCSNCGRKDHVRGAGDLEIGRISGNGRDRVAGVRYGGCVVADVARRRLQAMQDKLSPKSLRGLGASDVLHVGNACLRDTPGFGVDAVKEIRDGQRRDRCPHVFGGREDGSDEIARRERTCGVVDENDLFARSAHAGKRRVPSYVAAFDKPAVRRHSLCQTSAFIHVVPPQDDDEFLDSRNTEKRTDGVLEKRNPQQGKEDLVSLRVHANTAAGGKKNGASRHGVADASIDVTLRSVSVSGSMVKISQDSERFELK